MRVPSTLSTWALLSTSAVAMVLLLAALLGFGFVASSALLIAGY